MEKSSTLQETEQSISTYTKIICPVDFSETAMNAVEYATKIAQKFSIELYLLNVKPLLYSQLIGGNADILRETVVESKKQLDKICTEANKMLHVSCKSEVIVSYSSIDKIITGETTDKKNLIIMGTNGIDSLYQLFLGTNTFNVIQKAKCPVLIIPEKTAYSTITEVVYAWTYGKSEIYIEQALLFAKQFEANICILYIGKSKDDITTPEYQTALQNIEKLLQEKNIQYSFEHIYPDDIANGIKKQMIKKENSVLVIPVQHRNFIEIAFKGNPVKNISTDATFPVLFVHKEDH